MKIGKTPGSVNGVNTPASAGSGAAQRTSGSGSAGSAATAAGPAQTGGAKVTLSPALAQLQNAMSLAGSGEVFDASQVASIKQAISSGQFQVDPEKVADKLIQSVKELLGTQATGQGA